MSNISYIRILQAIESFSNAHLQIKKFASDFPAQMPNFATQDEAYPILFVSPTSSIFDMNTNRFELDIYCFDIIQKDRENINTILSDTNQILNDLNRWFLDGDLFGIDWISSSTVTPIDNALLDYAAGWQMRIILEVDTYGICEIPFSESPVVITEVNNIVYSQYLTCETLEDCSVIQNIQSQLTGRTNIDIYVTGATYSNGTATFTNNTGGTFSVTGFTTGDTQTTPNLQQVTDFGNTTNNQINLLFNDSNGIILSPQDNDSIIQISNDVGVALFYTSTLTLSYFNSSVQLTPELLYLISENIQPNILLAGPYGGVYVKTDNLTNLTTGYDAQLPDKPAGTYTFAMLDDIPSPTPLQDLQSVLSQGATSNLNFQLYSGFDTLNVGYNQIQFVNTNGTGTYTPNNITLAAVEPSINLANSNGGSVLFKVNNLIEGYDAQLPNKPAGTYTFAMLDDIPTLNEYVQYTGASQNVDLGNFTLKASTLSASTYFNLPLDIRVTGATKNGTTAIFTNNTGGTFTLTGLTDIFTTGGTYNSINSTITFTNNTGGTFNVSGFTSNNGLFTGGTVSGSTNFTNGLSATSISATTYQNLPLDVMVTGGTYFNGTATFTNNTGGTFNVSGFNTGYTLTSNEIETTLGYTPISADTNTFTTGATKSGSVATFTNNTGGTFTLTGLTDVTITAGTYTASAGTATFTNNTGGTFNVSGFNDETSFIVISDGIPSSGFTGGTSSTRTLVKSYKIPANTFSAGDIFQIYAFYGKTGTSTIFNLEVNTNTGNTLVGSVSMGRSSNGGATITHSVYERTISFSSSTNMRIFNVNNFAQSDIGGQVGLPFTTVNFNTAIDNWLLFSIIPNTGGTSDNMWIERIVITKSKYKITT